jgi:hypothetical protein
VASRPTSKISELHAFELRKKLRYSELEEKAGVGAQFEQIT